MASLDSYVDLGYWVDGYAVGYINPTVPTWAVNPVTQILPSYLYQQYQPDSDIESFFIAYNNQAQTSMDFVTNLNLPVWTSNSITGVLLDWVALNLYGINRPVLAVPTTVLLGGVYNSSLYNTTPYNQTGIAVENLTIPVNDDIFKRCLTWNLYKGDGFQFNARWLKNRVQRFLVGTNGLAENIDNTYNISVTYGSSNSITITINSSFAQSIAPILESAINAQVLNLPFQYTYTVVI